MTSRRRIVLAIGTACAVTFVHLVTELTTWAVWDAAPMPGRQYPHPIPALWPVISFPVFTLYDVLSGGDRAMFRTFWPAMIANTMVWGVAAYTIVLALTKPRARALESGANRAT